MSAISDFENELFQKAPKLYGKWHAIDLHNHSPSSFDYIGDRATAAQLSADQILKTNLSIVMFTDHEKLPDLSFIDEVKRRTGRTILRGIELNVFVDAWGKPQGKVDKNLFFHLLIGFDPAGKQSPEYWVTHLYKECKAERRDCGGTEIFGVSAPIEKIHAVLNEANAIIIPAHLHSTRDAFRSRSIDDIYSDPEFLKAAKEHFTALEVTDPRTAEFFDGKHAETQHLNKTCIVSSDAHEPARLGARVTFAQMESPTFSELKAALELPFRISLAPPAEPPAYVIGLHIRGQFYRDLWFTLSPHCNVLIGVKGSGKTSILEALRFGLGATVPVSRQEAVSSHLQNIFGATGSVRVLVKRADGAKILIERFFESKEFKVIFENDKRESFVSSEGLLFPSYILGWHEIEQAATDVNIRQVYLDTIAGQEKMRSLYEAADNAAKQIRHLHEVASNKYGAFRSLHEQVGRLEELRKGLQELTDGNLIALRDQYEASVRHRDAVEELRKSLQTAHDETENRTAHLSVTVGKAPFEGPSPVGKYAEAAYGLIEGLKGRLSTFASAHKGELHSILEQVDSLRREISAEFEIFYKDYTEKLALLPPEKRRLLETHQQVMESTKSLPRLRNDQESMKQEIDSLLNELVSLCGSVADHLDERTQIRITKVAELNSQLESFGVHLTVEPLGIRARLDTLSQQYAIGAKIYGELSSAFGAQESRTHRRIAKAYENLRENLLGGFRLFFDSSEFGYFVNFFEEDDLKIRFKVGKAGEEYSPIDQLSAGQRCTAVFPLLLRLQAGPLIVDQPEDNLDNRHIADVIAPALLQDKKIRQIAFTSHNANLVVLTDAEHIATFEATGSEGRIEARGFLCASQSPITKHVIGILDGGDRALELRYKKYGTLAPA